jgi:Holliday junction resolvase
MTNSRQKGKRGERELANYLQDAGLVARRGQQHRGGPDSPDVICESLPWLHIECKRGQRLNLHDAMVQSVTEAPAGSVPVVMHRKNRQPWMVTMRIDDFLELAKDAR